MAGLLGMGGMNGFSPDMGLQSLLGDAYDPAALRNMQLKRGLLGAGAAMLSQGPSQYPVGFGQMLGQGLGAGLNAAGQAQDDYMQQAKTAFDVKRMGINDEWSQREQARKEKEWAEADKRKAAFDEMIGGLPQDQQQFAQMYPDQFGKQKAAQLFPENAERPEVFGTPIWGSDQKPYYVNKYGKAQPVEGIPEGITVSDPYLTAFKRAQGSSEGDKRGDAIASAPSDIAAADSALSVISKIENHPYLDRGVGGTSIGNVVWGTGGYDFQNLVDQARSGAFLTAIESMRGLGSLSNAEGETAKQAITRMNTATSKEAFLDALADYRNEVMKGRARAEARIVSGGNQSPSGQMQAQPVPQPNGGNGWIDIGGGAKMRRKQ